MSTRLQIPGRLLAQDIPEPYDVGNLAPRHFAEYKHDMAVVASKSVIIDASDLAEAFCHMDDLTLPQVPYAPPSKHYIVGMIVGDYEYAIICEHVAFDESGSAVMSFGVAEHRPAVTNGLPAESVICINAIALDNQEAMLIRDITFCVHIDAEGIAFGVSSKGKRIAIGMNNNNGDARLIMPVRINYEHEDDTTLKGAAFCNYAVAVMSSLSATTVETADPIRYQRASGKTVDFPDVEYKTLKLKQRINRHNPLESGRGSHASPKAHGVRGHWRILRKNRRKPVSVWIAPHMRGDISKGLVIKNYQLAI